MHQAYQTAMIDSSLHTVQVRHSNHESSGRTVRTHTTNLLDRTELTGRALLQTFADLAEEVGGRLGRGHDDPGGG